MKAVATEIDVGELLLGDFSRARPSAVLTDLLRALRAPNKTGPTGREILAQG